MLAEQYLETASEKLPVVKRAIREYGELSLLEYLRNFALKPVPAYQQRADLADAISRYGIPLFGESVTRQVIHDLDAYPVILTSNHLGVEYFSQSLQSSLMLSLNSVAGNLSALTVPVFSFGNVPLNNLTYPRGALLHHTNSDEASDMPLKLPVFPDRFKRQIASVAQGFDRGMVRRAKARLDKMVRKGHIPRAIADAMHTVFEEDYCADSVLGLSSYSEQSVVLNRRIWNRLFSECVAVPELAYFEIEKIAAILLEKDLLNPESLAYGIVFDPVLRKHVLEKLDRMKGCWDMKNLSLRPGKTRRKMSGNYGTVLFWGIDDFGRRIPLYLEIGDADAVFLGTDDNGKIRKLDCKPHTLIAALRENRIIPSLFTCFLTLSFARGLICIGGYFQGEYLPVMQQGLICALQETEGYGDAAHRVAQVPADAYLSGMLAVMSETEDKCLVPAGPAEIIAGRGLTIEDIQQMSSLTVRDAHIAGLFETAPDAVPPKSRPVNWKKQLAADCFQLLKGKIAVKGV
jgi:hypothetical protein